MKLTVKLFATFRQGRFDVSELERADGLTVGGLVAELGLPAADLGFVLVQGRHAPLDQLLAAGDTVAIFPKVGGG